ncbi:hypothetical protein HFO56_24185 [Rhizobium laguerreae]|uniref:hypothetical protein n=1 Tax=Rhizobium laguerreae TaxID=1076926 RepID=UPI001C91A7D3|nr:hypothetical protein [Rhizobium laguerreae]MBY3155429.1 hypothetical protein [Rhizobium laguerreae]
MHNSYIGYHGPVSLHAMGRDATRSTFTGHLEFPDPSALRAYLCLRGWLGPARTFVFDEAVDRLVLRSVGWSCESGPSVKLDVNLIVRDDCGVRIPVAAVKAMFAISEKAARKCREDAREAKCPAAPPFRAGPVPWTGKRRFRYAGSFPNMFPEVAANDFLRYDHDCLDHRLSERCRRTRSALVGPVWDDYGRDYRSRSWKATRRTQWKE